MNSEGLDQSVHCAVWSWHSLFAYHVSSDTAKKTTSTRFKSSLVTITGPLKSLFLGIHLFAYDFPALLSLIYRGVVPTSDEVAVFPLAFSSESAKEEQDASDSFKEIIKGDSNPNYNYVLSERALQTMNFDTSFIKIGWKMGKLWAYKEFNMANI